MTPSTRSTALRALLAAATLLVLAAAPVPAYAICGDTILDDGEQCDDGNTASGDCCDVECQAEGAESPCPDDGTTCTFDFCDGKGACIHPVNQGNECDDGNPCTFGGICDASGTCIPSGVAEDGSGCLDKDLCGGFGQCGSGVCKGDPADCSVFAGPCKRAACNGESGLCEVTPLGDGTVCDDPDPCTDPGQCMSGECIQPPTDCSGFADACNDADCDSQNDGCFSVPKPDGTACDDNNGCTDPGTCSSGTCQTTPKDCSAFGDQCNDAFCNPKSIDGCFSLPKEGTPACDDGDACTTGDACSDGVCIGTPVDCSGAGDACNIGVCNPQDGSCEPQPDPEATECSDGDFCTTGDTCTEGTCAGTPVDCSRLGDQCNVGFCRPESGSCDSEPAPDQTGCDDGDLCTTGDACSSGECGGTPVDCSGTDDECNVGACNGETGSCDAVPREDQTPCSDGNLCTTGDACSAGQCAGAPVDCSGSDDQCNVGTCDGETGSCDAVPRDDQTPCDDGDLCTTGDVCTAGECAGTDVDCSGAGNQCNTGFCDGETGSCDSRPVDDDTPCSDNDRCTTGDVCTSGECGGTPVDCSESGGSCTVGTCNVESGLCEGVPVEDGSACNDGQACTTGDQCESGACVGTPVDCSDLDDDCNTGECDASGQCVATPVEDGTACNDGAFCTKTDTCSSGTCAGTGDPCEGNPVCSASCDEAGDSCFAASGTPCEDDANPCTDDVCDGEGSCTPVANEETCDDGLFCTSNDRCEDGGCVGDPTCPPTEACSDTCNEDEDVCRRCGHPFSDTRCIVNAVFVLQGALALRECEICTCDVDSSGSVTVTDALMVLMTCAKLPTVLACPEAGGSTTTTTFPSP